MNTAMMLGQLSTNDYEKVACSTMESIDGLDQSMVDTSQAG